MGMRQWWRRWRLCYLTCTFPSPPDPGGTSALPHDSRRGLQSASGHDIRLLFYPGEKPCNGFSEALHRYREIVPHLSLAAMRGDEGMAQSNLLFTNSQSKPRIGRWTNFKNQSYQLLCQS